jgi:hypothetical protein
MDLIGKQFGSWTVLRAGQISLRGKKRWMWTWICRCKCGNEHAVLTGNLTSGHSTMCRACGQRERWGTRPFEAMLRLVSRRAMEAKREFTLSYEEFVVIAQVGTCHYCGAPVRIRPYVCTGIGGSYQLDRKDNSKGYVAGNVVSCCKRCNYAKGNRFTYSEWWAMTECFRSGRMPNQTQDKGELT